MFQLSAGCVVAVEGLRRLQLDVLYDSSIQHLDLFVYQLRICMAGLSPSPAFPVLRVTTITDMIYGRDGNQPLRCLWGRSLLTLFSLCVCVAAETQMPFSLEAEDNHRKLSSVCVCVCVCIKVWGLCWVTNTGLSSLLSASITTILEAFLYRWKMSSICPPLDVK